MGLAYGFRGVVHYCHSRKHDGLQAEKVLEKELGVPHPYLQAAARERHCLENLKPQRLPQ